MNFNVGGRESESRISNQSQPQSPFLSPGPHGGFQIVNPPSPSSNLLNAQVPGTNFNVSDSLPIPNLISLPAQNLNLGQQISLGPGNSDTNPQLSKSRKGSSIGNSLGGKTFSDNSNYVIQGKSASGPGGHGGKLEGKSVSGGGKLEGKSVSGGGVLNSHGKS